MDGGAELGGVGDPRVVRQLLVAEAGVHRLDTRGVRPPQTAPSPLEILLQKFDLCQQQNRRFIITDYCYMFLKVFFVCYLEVRIHNMDFGSPVGVPEPEDHLERLPELGHHHGVAGGQGAADGDLVDHPQAPQIPDNLLTVGEHEELVEVLLLPHLTDVVPVEVSPVQAGSLRHTDLVVDVLEPPGPLLVEDLEELVGRAQVHAVEGVRRRHQQHRQLLVPRRKLDRDVVTVLVLGQL